MTDTSTDRRMKLLIFAGAIASIALASTVFGGRNQSGSKKGNPAHEDAPIAATTASTTGATKLEFNTQPKQLIPGSPAIWLLKIYDAKTNRSVRSFETVRDKMMHLIVVSKDLSWFAHLTPEYKDHGLFITRTPLPHAGSYKLFADYTPRDGTREVTQREINIGGANPPLVRLPLAADIIGKSKSGWMLGRATARPEGEANDGNDSANLKGRVYQVALMPKPAKIVAGEPVILHFSVRDDAAGTYVSDLKPYLGAMGYVVIISGDAKTYVPAEPMKNDVANLNSNEPTVAFRATFPTAGLYKVWAEFQHKSYIITASFVLRVEASSEASTTTKQAAYYCPMHPEITSNDPRATCPKCGGMKLAKRS